MANQILINQAKDMYAAATDTTDYAELLTKPTIDLYNKKLEEQKKKIDELIATMPAGVNIAKVPEELRGQVTDYLTENKAAYVKYGKIIASGIPSTDPRYIEAIAKMNQIRGGFEVLDDSLVKLAEIRKLSLENKDSISPFATNPQATLQLKFGSGDIYKELSLRDGVFYYKDENGKEINASDYILPAQKQAVITSGIEPAHEYAIQAKRNGEEWVENRYRSSIRETLTKAGKNACGDFAYSGVLGYEFGQTQFIEKYIEETHGVTKGDEDKKIMLDDGTSISVKSDKSKFDQYYESYKAADFSPNTSIGRKLEDYLVNTIKGSYDGAKTTATGNEYKPGNYIIGNREIRPETFNRMYKPHVDILNKGTTGEDDGKLIVRKAPNGIRYRGSDDKGWQIYDPTQEKFVNSTKPDIATSIGFDESHGIDFAITGSTEVGGGGGGREEEEELTPPPKELTVLEEGEEAKVRMGGIKYSPVKKVDGIWYVKTKHYFGDDPMGGFTKATTDQIKRINKEYK